MLDTSGWRGFQVGSLFEIQNGKGITNEEIADHPGELDAVQSGENNFGVIGKIDLSYCRRAGYTLTEYPCLTVARSGTSGYVAYHNAGCVVGDSAKLLLLKDKNHSSELVYLFLRTVLEINRYRYSYGNKVTSEKYRKIILKLPATTNIAGQVTPDWAWMEAFMSRYYQGPLQSQNQSSGQSLDVGTWQEFRVGSLFKLQRGKCHDSDSLDDGDDVFYVGAKKDDNGIMRRVAYQPGMVFDGNCMIFICNGAGSVGYALYQDREFIPSGDLIIGYNDNLNPYVGLFLVPILDRERAKYSFGRKWGKYVADTIIKLPATTDAKGHIVPDWAWMEQYVRSLPYSDLI